MQKKSIAIVGSGPAALMAAEKLCKYCKVVVFEKRASAGWKLLVAGSSGLNVSNGANMDVFYKHYSHPDFFKKYLETYTVENWLHLLSDLGQEPFLGTSNRYFVKEMTAALLVKNWIDRLKAQIEFHFSETFLDFSDANNKIYLTTDKGSYAFDCLIFALGGPSWEQNCNWPQIFKSKGIRLVDFEPANSGYHINASPDFFAKAEGKPIKGLKLTTKLGAKVGELMITRYGLEGTPIYTLGIPGEAEFDLKPDLEEDKLANRLKGPGNIYDRIKKFAKLSEGSFLLFKEYSGPVTNEVEAAAQLKHLKVELTHSRPLQESISCKGGVDWNELTETLALKKYPNIYCAGEMIDWHAPTGGFLIQGCVSMGAHIAKNILKLP